MPEARLPSGVTLHYAGTPGAGETVLLVNGLTMDTTAWRGVAERLSSPYAPLRYDCRGQGESDKPPGPYAPETHCDDLLALLDALELARVHLVGLSNGGLVALLAAAAAPERVKSLVMIDSFARVDARLRFVLSSWRAALEQGGAGLRFDVATPWVWGSAFLAQHEAELGTLREAAAQADTEAVAALIEGLAGFGDAREALTRYPGPLLAMVGEDDVLTPPRFSREIVAAAGRGELLLVPEAGHAAPIERPAWVAAALQDFWRSL